MQAQQKPDWEYIETGAEPEFFVTRIRTESAGGGNVRVFCYSSRHQNQMHLLFTAIVPAMELSEMARIALVASAEAHNAESWRGDATEQ